MALNKFDLCRYWVLFCRKRTKDMERKRVALLVETSLASGREILRGIAKYAQEINEWELYHVAGGLESSMPKWLENWSGDGIIARLQTQELVEKLRLLKVPVVDVLGEVEESEFSLVHVDDGKVAAMVAEHFKEKGFRQFAFYGIRGENWSRLRQEGFQKACRKEVPFLEIERVMGDDPDQGFAEVRRWVKDLPKPVGIFVASDQRGLVLLEACRAEGIVVPQEVAVVGVDNDVPLCEISSPSLTSVRAGHFQVGYQAAKQLDQQMLGQPISPEPFLVSPTALVIRGSSDSQAIQDPIVATGVHYLQQHLSEPITNEDIARAAGVSRTLFQQRFRQEMNCTVRNFLIQCRLDRARMLIASSDLTLADIAQRCGFKHQEYLGDVFKRHFGKTPAQYRNHQEGSTTNSDFL